MNSEKDAQIANLLGAIANEASALLGKLSGKPQATIVITLDGERLHYMSTLPVDKILAVAECIVAQLKEQTPGTKLILPEAVRMAMN